MNYQKLFDHMREAHGLILLESEMEEIVRAVNDIKNKPIITNERTNLTNLRRMDANRFRTNRPDAIL
jgi:shikimate kinase